MNKNLLKVLALPLLFILVVAELFTHFVMYISYYIFKPFGWFFIGTLIIGGLFGGMHGMSWWEIIGLFIFAYIVCMIPEVLVTIYSKIKIFRQNIWFFIKDREPYSY